MSQVYASIRLLLLVGCLVSTALAATPVPDKMLSLLQRLEVSASQEQVSADLARLAENPRAGLTYLMDERPYDYVSILLAQHLVTRPASARFHVLYQCFYQQLEKSQPQPGRCAQTSPRENLAVLFVPGWLYISDTTTGADFAEQRARLTQAGIVNELVPVKENGTVAENAAIVAQVLRERLAEGERVLLVSASKGGPEAALALTQVNDAGPGQIKGWVNVGGLLGGTPLADKGSRFPWSLFSKYVLLNGGSLDGIRSLTTDAARQRQKTIGTLDDFLIVNLVALPFAAHLDERVEMGFKLMEDEGPNDGMTLALDVIQPGEHSVVLPMVGLDHYFAHEAPGRMTMALVHAVLAFDVPPDD